MTKAIQITLILTLLLSFNLHSQCPVNNNNIYSFTYSGNSYEIVKENLKWTDAAACAVLRGGYLTEINSQQEQDTIFMHVNNASIIANNTVAPDGGGASYLWIGGNDITVEGNWVWDGNNDMTSTQFWQGTSSGVPIGGLYNNWGNEPDDFNGQDALGLAYTNWPLGVAGQWNDVDTGNTLYYIIEHTGLITNIENNELLKEVTIYPNPTQNLITIDFGANQIKNTTIEVMDLLGKVIYQQNIISIKTIINLNNYNQGLYLIKVSNDEGNKTYKVIKE